MNHLMVHDEPYGKNPGSVYVLRYEDAEMRESFTLTEVKALKAGEVVAHNPKHGGASRYVLLDVLGKAKLGLL